MRPIFLLMLFANTIPSYSYLTSSNYPPVILVPGYGASQLQSRVTKPSSINGFCDVIQWMVATVFPNTYFNTWINPFIWIPGLEYCSRMLLKLNYDNVTRTTTNQPDVETRVMGFGDPYWLMFYDHHNNIISKVLRWFVDMSYFKHIIDALSDIGYKRNVNLRGAPFDFRKGPSESQDYFRNLKKLVEETYRMNGNKKVVFVAHSYGGQMTVVFVRSQSQRWRDKYIKAVISMAAPLAGTEKSVRIYAVGDEMGPYFRWYDEGIKELARSFPSSAFTLPNRRVWKNRALVSTPWMNYTLHNLKGFFKRMNALHSWEMWKDQLPYASLEPPRVEFHCLYGTTRKSKTTEKLIFNDPSDFPDYPDYEYGAGDTTVNLRRLNYCSKWAKQQKQHVYVQHFQNMDHMQILSDRRTISYMKDVLKGYAEEYEMGIY